VFVYRPGKTTWREGICRQTDTPNQLRYLDHWCGRCLSFVKAHPGNQYFAAAECGTNPDINVFEFPSLKLYRILKGGAEQSYVNMNFRQVPVFQRIVDYWIGIRIHGEYRFGFSNKVHSIKVSESGFIFGESCLNTVSLVTLVKWCNNGNNCCKQTAAWLWRIKLY